MGTADKDELLQILNEDGTFTNRLEDRKVIHNEGLWHAEVACIIINNRKQILLQKRNKNKKSYPSCWGLCAGHVVGFDSIEDAIIKEMREELVSEIKRENIFLLVPKTKNEREDNRCFVTCYCAIIDKSANDFLYQEDEIEELRWFTFDEFKQMVEKEDGTIFKNNEYYNKIIVELDKLFSSKNLHKKFDELVEKLEELDSDGNPTGKIITREYAHNYGIYHQAYSLVIYNNKNEILLQKRSPTKIRNAGLWDISVSGHSKYGEDAETTLMREAEEETNFIIDPKEMEFLVKHKENRQFNEKFIDNTFFDVYITKIDDKLEQVKNLEVDGLRFISIDELKEMMKNYKKLAYKPEAFDAVIKYFEEKDER